MVFIVNIGLIIFFVPFSWVATFIGFAFTKAYSSIWATMAIGTVSIFFGSWIGSVGAFCIGRYLLRGMVKKLQAKNKLMTAIDVTMETKGLRLIVLMKLSLLIPSNLLNYVLGASAVKATDYVIGTSGILPVVIFFLYVGSTMSGI